MADLSTVSGETFYSGPWTNVQDVCKSLKLGEGKLSTISQEMVNRYQERADRQIDGELERYYYVPVRPYNIWIQATSVTQSVFPGMIRKIALYLTAGLLLTSEFQQMEPNMLEAAQNYINDSKRELFEIIKFTRRIPGQRTKSNLRTMPPNMQPGYVPELNI